MYLVNDEDDVADFLHLIDEALHAALELAAELRAGHERGQVEQVHFLVAHLERNAALVDADSEALRDCGLADARLADEAGIVLLTAVQNLNDAVGLAVAADDVVDTALCRLARQVFAVVVEVLALLVVTLRTAALIAALRTLLCRTGRGGRGGHGIGFVRRVLVRAVRTGGHEVIEVGQRADFAGKRFQVVLGDTHLLHDIVERLDAEFACAFKAQALLRGFVRAFDFGDEHHRDVFLASRAHWHIHSWLYSFLLQGT